MISSTTNNRRAFTLVEMLAVIAIAAIIIVIALPALKTLSAAGIQAGARQFGSAVQLARQYAINLRTPVRVVIAVDLTDMGPNATNWIARAYAIYFRSNDVNGVEAGWRPLQDWSSLPDGVIFSDLNASSYNTINMDRAPDPGQNPRYLGPGPTASAWQYFDSTQRVFIVTNLINSAGTTITASVIEFRPTGQVSSIRNGPAGGVRLVSGSVANPPTRDLVVNDTNNWVYIEYDAFGGRVRTRYRDSYRQ